jgi:hypothetical protein
MNSSIAVGQFVNRFRPGATKVKRWRGSAGKRKRELVQIH